MVSHHEPPEPALAPATAPHTQGHSLTPPPCLQSSLTLPSSPMDNTDGDRDAFDTCMGEQALADAANHPFPRLRSITTCLGRRQSLSRAAEASTPHSARHTEPECVSDRGASDPLASAPSVAPATIDMLWMGSPVASSARASGDAQSRFGRGRGGLFGWLRGVSGPAGGGRGAEWGCFAGNDALLT